MTFGMTAPAYAVEDAALVGASAEAAPEASVEASVEDSAEGSSEASSEAASEASADSSFPGEEESTEETGSEVNEDDEDQDASDEAAEENASEDDAEKESEESSEDAAGVSDTGASDEAASAESSMEQDVSADEASLEASEEIIEITEDETLVTAEHNNDYDSETNIAYKNGVAVTGWANISEDNRVLSVGKIDLKAAYTLYFIEPGTTPEDGFYEIKGELYNFAGGRLDKDASRNGNVLVKVYYKGAYRYYCIDKYGHVKRGWQKITAENKEYCFLDYGYRAWQTWVTKNGKKIYVDANGDPANGVVTLSGGSLFFVNGEKKTGFIYVNASLKKVAAEKARYVMYFNPYASYQGKLETGGFTFKGKDYAPSDGTVLMGEEDYAPKGAIPLNCIYSYNGYMVITDKTGAIQKNKLVTNGGRQYYADENGRLITNATRVINGKTCYFGADGSMTVVSEDAVKLDLYYRSGDELLSVYFRSTNMKKASDGISYYSDAECRTRLKNCALYDAKGSVLACLDGKGNQVTGLRKVDSDTYYFDSTGFVPSNVVTVLYKNKVYLIDPASAGKVVTEPGFHYGNVEDGYSSNTGRWYYVKDNTGALALGKTVIDGKTYAFNNDTSNINRGSLCYGGMKVKTDDYAYGITLGEHWFYMGGRTYYCNYTEQPLYNDDKSAGDADVYARASYLLVGKRQHFSDESGTIYVVNEDGTAFSGIYKLGEGNVAIVSEGEVPTYEGRNVLTFWEGKMYLFGKNNYAKTGWQKVSAGTAFYYMNGSKIKIEKVPVDSYYYFDPDSCAGVSGWKTVPEPIIDSNGNVLGTSGEKKYYFAETATAKLPQAAWAHNIDLTIKNKTYHFNEKGETVNEAVNKSGRNETRYYSPRTGKAETNVLRKTGKKWYYYGSDGVQDSSFAGTISDGNQVLVTYNKDGSIKKFSVKNTIIRVNDSYYAIGSNGLPVTGIYKLSTEQASKYGASRIFIESDGYFAGFESTGVYSIRKISGKYYVLDGAVLQNGVSEYNVTDCSALSVSDISEITRCLSYTGSSIEDGFYVIVAADGTLKASKYTESKVTLRTNRYGMVLDLLSPFVKVNGSWYITSLASNSGNSMILQLQPAQDDRASSKYVNVCWDSNGKIKSINYAVNKVDTGVPVSGVYLLPNDYAMLAVNLKNGKIVTGKKKGYFQGMNVTLNFDSVFGTAVVGTMGY